MSVDSRCRQCHVFAGTSELFQESTFVGFTGADLRGDRAYPAAPPLIPHAIFMREDCVTCHAGVAARLELVCQHSERTNCRQCHITQANSSKFASP
ncbi:MAG: hypothetical protein NT069_20820 [Planctomycetota bacterium]|nr:hypothetical protein [Planctomycetota bacterium]